MTQDERNEHVRAVFNKYLLPILNTKGEDYSGNADINSNFHIAAERIGNASIDKYVIWQVYFTKHMMAIETWLRDRGVKSEPIHMRMVDAINYLLILWSMGTDDGLMPSPVNPGVKTDYKGPNDAMTQGVEREYFGAPKVPENV